MVAIPEYKDQDKSDWTYQFEWRWLTWIKDIRQRRGFNSKWYDRNEKYGDVFVETLQMPVIKFQQTMFVAQSGDLMLMFTLGKLGFKPVVSYPDYDSYKDFIDMLYWEKYNIALALWVKPEYEQKIKNAIEIATQTVNDSYTQKNIFFNTMKVLLANV